MCRSTYLARIATSLCDSTSEYRCKKRAGADEASYHLFQRFQSMRNDWPPKQAGFFIQIRESLVRYYRSTKDRGSDYGSEPNDSGDTPDRDGAATSMNVLANLDDDDDEKVTLAASHVDIDAANKRKILALTTAMCYAISSKCTSREAEWINRRSLVIFVPGFGSVARLYIVSRIFLAVIAQF